MPWPDQDKKRYDRSLREVFDEIPVEILSKAARVIYYYGHLSPDGHARIGLGGTWKFARYADQSISERLDFHNAGTKRGRNHPNGISMHTCDGALRLCAQTNEMWTWREVGYTTQKNVNEAYKLSSEIKRTPPLVRRDREVWEDVATKIIEMVRDRMLPDPSTMDGRFFRMGDLFTIDD
jgi:hypothetical protein